MGRALRDHPALGPCLVRNLYRYATGRDVTTGEAALLDFLNERFADSEYEVRELMRELVLSDGFRTTSGPRKAEEPGDES